MTTAVAPEERSAGRVEYLDLLRILAMIGVVFIHASATTKYVVGQPLSPEWHFANVFTALARAGVPLFFMISGAVLLSSERTLSIGHTLKRRVPRLLVPFLVWSVVYIGYRFGAGWQRTGVLDWAAVGEKLEHLALRPVTVPMWFMYVIIPLYLLSPLIKRLVDSLSRTLAIYLVGLWALFSCLLPTIVSVATGGADTDVLLLDIASLSVAPVYMGYFIVGYYLMKLRRPIAKKWLVAFICADALVMILGTWWRTQVVGSYITVFMGYSHVFTVTMACALFLLCKECLRDRRLGRRTARVVGVLAPLTFGMYLVHPMIIDLLTAWQPMLSVKSLVAYFGAELLASVACVLVLSAIKPLCYVFTGRDYTPWWRRPGHGGGTAERTAAEPVS